MDLPNPVRLIPLLLFATASCSGGSTSQVAPIAPDQSCVTGKVFSVGTDFEPATVLSLDNKTQVRVTGRQEEEIRRLSGTVVTICGEQTTDIRIGSAVEATSFELRSVDGMTAYLGSLNHTDGRWELTSNNEAAPVPLSGVSDQLRSAEGSLVWVAGTWGDQVLSVKAFGLMNRK